MKLMYCPLCGDIVRLERHTKSCGCGHSRGLYNDDLNATILNGIPIGFDNLDFYLALQKSNVPADKGHEFTAFVIPPNAVSVERVKGNDNAKSM